MLNPPPPHPLPLDVLVLALSHWRDDLTAAHTELLAAARTHDWATVEKARGTVDHVSRNIGTALNICQYRLDYPSIPAGGPEC
jgi:hypothetical protein